MDFGNLKIFLDNWAEEFTPGCQIVIYKDNKKVYSYHTGFYDVESNIKLKGNELFNLYSCSKVATVTAALQFYEKGVFLLDDPLYEYIPEFKEMYIKDEDGNTRKAVKPITMRNLFTMTAGYSYDFLTPGFEKANKITNGKNDTLTVMKSIASDPLHFEPGEKWNYSICHDILAGAVQAMTGMRFSEYVTKNIFDPLGIKDAYYHVPETEKGRVAQQYQFDPDGIITDDITENLGKKQPESGVMRRIDKGVAHVLGDEYDSGGAGVTATCEDYALFAHALANRGVGLSGERILSPHTIDLMRTNHLTENQMKTYTWGDLCGYGYGLGVRTQMKTADSCTISNFGEFGWSGAAGAVLIADPKENLAVFFTQHVINSRWSYFGPRLFNVIYYCLNG